MISADCSADPNAKASAIFYEVYNPNLILGNSQNILEVGRKGQSKYDMLHDLRLTFECPGSWILEGTQNATNFAPGKENDTNGYSLVNRNLEVDS